MARGSEHLADKLASLEVEAARVCAGATPLLRWRADVAAALFHLRPRSGPPAVCLIGGTGTGKSTLLNRLLEAELCAASFRRTFTAGAIAVTQDTAQVPARYLGLEHAPAEVPARGRAESLAVLAHAHPLTEALILLDTPDLDGDQPTHHAEADRAFRWAEGLLFLVTPEKYQMTELLPYYRLARRYAVPALFVMNKCEEAQVLEDYRQQLAQREHLGAGVYAIPRDDAGYEPPPGSDLGGLRQALGELGAQIQSRRSTSDHRAGMHRRCFDLVGRLRDQVTAPLRQRRRAIDQTIAALRGMTAAPVGVDVSPVTHQLQRRMQEQSILYLMGPQRIFERVRQVPGFLAVLPRAAWDLVRGKSVSLPSAAGDQAPPAPDFPTILAEQFTILQARIDDTVRQSDELRTLWESPQAAETRLPASEAGQIAEKELAELKAWLEQHWEQRPRDTRLVEKFLKLLPGGRHLSKWSEAAPYLLAVIVAAKGAIFGPIDLIILGSFSLATWLGEKLSNEVTSRAQAANRDIARAYAALARRQIDRVCAFLQRLAPALADLDRVDALADALAAEVTP